MFNMQFLSKYAHVRFRGFDSHMKQFFVWSTNRGFGSGCHMNVNLYFVNALSTHEKIIGWGNLTTKKNLRLLYRETKTWYYSCTVIYNYFIVKTTITNISVHKICNMTFVLSTHCFMSSTRVLWLYGWTFVFIFIYGYWDLLVRMSVRCFVCLFVCVFLLNGIYDIVLC